MDGKRRRLPQAPLNLDGAAIEFSSVIRYLGVHIDRKLLFRQHICIARSKAIAAFRAIYGMVSKTSLLSTKTKLLLYKSIVRPIMCWGAEIWRHSAKSNRNPLQIVQSGCLKCILKLPRRYPTTQLTLIDDFINDMAAKMTTRCALSDDQIILAIIEP